VTCKSNFCQVTLIKKVCLFVSVENNFLIFIDCSRQKEIQFSESPRMIVTHVFCRADSNISTTCFKRSRKRGEFVLTTYQLSWDSVDAGEWSASLPTHLPPWQNSPPYPLDTRLVGSQGRSGPSGKEKRLCSCWK
jgi:hypothetical protein